MGEKEKEDIYHSFSRKDLQVLCKKYGLPANKSNSEMATSLILYLEKMNMTSRVVWEVTRSHPYPSGLAELQAAVSMKLVGDQSKDCRDMASRRGHHNNQFRNRRYASPKNIQEIQGPATSDKASDDVDVLTQLRRDRNSTSSFPGTAVSSVASSTTEAHLPSFTFEVSAENGIQLIVDLNSNTSEWIKSMKAGVHICPGAHNLEANISHQEVGQICSSEQNELDGQLKDGSDPTTEITGVAPRVDEPGGGEVSLSSPGQKSSSFTVHNLEHLSQDQALLSSRSGPDIDGQNLGPESVMRLEKVVATAPVRPVATRIKTNNFPGFSILGDYKFAESGNCGLKIGDGLYKEPCLRQTCGLPDSTMKQNRLSEAASREIQASNCALVPHQEVGSSFLRVSTQLDSSDRLKNTEIAHLGLFSSKFSRDVLRMHPVQANDQNQYASSLSMGCPDSLGQKMEIGHGRASIFSKSNREIPEAQTQLDHSSKRTMSLLPSQRSQSLGFVNYTNSSGTHNIGVMSSHKAGQEAGELLKKDEYLNHCSSGWPCDLSAPMQSGVNNYILNYSNGFDKDIYWSQTRTNESLDVMNLSMSVETENGGMSSHQAGQEAVVLWKKDSSLSRGPFDLAVQKQNGANHGILDYSNNLDKDICRSQANTDVGVSGGGKTGNIRGSSECSGFRNSMEKPWNRAADSGSNGERNKKRHFSAVENCSQSVNSE